MNRLQTAIAHALGLYMARRIQGESGEVQLSTTQTTTASV